MSLRSFSKGIFLQRARVIYVQSGGMKLYSSFFIYIGHRRTSCYFFFFCKLADQLCILYIFQLNNEEQQKDKIQTVVIQCWNIQNVGLSLCPYNDGKSFKYYNQNNNKMEATHPDLLQKCQNCEKQIKSQIIDLHLRYCLKHIKKCTRCSQFYDLNMSVEHEEQFHVKQKCQHCSQYFEVDHIDSHKKQCGFKFVLCAYCDQKIPQSISEDHIKVCGSRTQQCETCTKIIAAKDKQYHSMVCWQQLQAEVKMKQAIMEEEERAGRRNRRGRNSTAVSIFESNPQKYRKTSQGRTFAENISQNMVKQKSRKNTKEEESEKKKTIGQFIDKRVKKQKNSISKTPIVIEDENQHEGSIEQLKPEKKKKSEETSEKKKKVNPIVDLESNFIKQDKKQDKKSD